MQTDRTKSSLDAFGRHINVKYIYLGSIFRQFVVSRTNVNYFHYVWPTCGALTSLGLAVLFLQVNCFHLYYCVIVCQVVDFSEHKK